MDERRGGRKRRINFAFKKDERTLGPSGGETYSQKGGEKKIRCRFEENET